MAIDKNLKELAVAIMKSNGTDHDTWLTEQYQVMVSENSKLLAESLMLRLETQK